MERLWNNPGEWLLDKVERQRNGSASLYSILQAIIPSLDQYQIQDIFQAEMEQDGFFDEEEAHYTFTPQEDAELVRVEEVAEDW